VKFNAQFPAQLPHKTLVVVALLTTQLVVDVAGFDVVTRINQRVKQTNAVRPARKRDYYAVCTPRRVKLNNCFHE
jgi:hypothetical protein